MPDQLPCQSEWPHGTPMRSAYHESTYRFRMEPVPGVRKGRGGPGWLRRPRTQRSRTWAYADCDDGILDVKAHLLPTAWEDIPRRRQRSWKSQRLCQSRSMNHRSDAAALYAAGCAENQYRFRESMNTVVGLSACQSRQEEERVAAWSFVRGLFLRRQRRA